MCWPGQLVVALPVKLGQVYPAVNDFTFQLKAAAFSQLVHTLLQPLFACLCADRVGYKQAKPAIRYTAFPYRESDIGFISGFEMFAHA